MYGHHFKYNGKKSSDYNLFTASFKNADNIPLALSRNVLRGNLNRFNNRPYHMGTQWSDVLVFTMSLIKDPCYDMNDYIFTEDEVDDIAAWLTSPDYPTLFHMYDYDTVQEEVEEVVLPQPSSENYVILESAESTGGTSTIVSGNEVIFSVSEADNSSVEISLDVTNGLEIGDDLCIMIEATNDLAHNSEYITISSSNGEHDYGSSTLSTIEMEGYYNSVTGEGYVGWIYKPGQLDNDSDLVLKFDAATTGSYDIKLKVVKLEQPTDTTGTTLEMITPQTITRLVPREVYNKRKYDYFGLFTDIQAEVIDDDIVGLTCTFTTNSPFAWTEEKTVKFTANEETEHEVHVDHSELYREVYPVITIKVPNGEGLHHEILFSNLTDNGKVIKMDLRPGTTTIDSSRSMIYDQTGLLNFDDIGIEDVGYIYFPKLYDGDNRIYVKGNAEITIKWREARKVGAY